MDSVLSAGYIEGRRVVSYRLGGAAGDNLPVFRFTGAGPGRTVLARVYPAPLAGIG